VKKKFSHFFAKTSSEKNQSMKYFEKRENFEKFSLVFIKDDKVNEVNYNRDLFFAIRNFFNGIFFFVKFFLLFFKSRDWNKNFLKIQFRKPISRIISPHLKLLIISSLSF